MRPIRRSSCPAARSSRAGLEFAAARVPSARFSQMDARHIPYPRGVRRDRRLRRPRAHRRGRARSWPKSRRPCARAAGSWRRSPSIPRSGASRTSTPTTSGATPRRGLRRKVEAAGFEVVRMTSFVSLLLPMLVAARLRTRGRTTDVGFDAIDELRQPHAVNVGSGGRDDRGALPHPSRACRSPPGFAAARGAQTARCRHGGPPVIPFNKPFMTGRELAYIAQAHANGHLAGNGQFSKRCCAWLEQRIGSQKALLTHSCTAALEMAAILSGVGPGDEVIMPSFTFVSTANAFVLRGAIAGLRRHPAGHAQHRRDPDRGGDHAADEGDRAGPLRRRRLRDGRDHGHRAPARPRWSSRTRRRASWPTTRDRPLGGIGHLAALSFHETKNIISGEGGALLVNDPRFVERAEIVREKGTNRSQFFRGQVDKYTWVDLGSSYLPGEIIAAFLWAQMEEADDDHEPAAGDLGGVPRRPSQTLERAGHLRRPIVPADRVAQRAHVLPAAARPRARGRRSSTGSRPRDPVGVPLRPAALVAVRADRPAASHGDMSVTDDASERLVRLPLWLGLEDQLPGVIDEVIEAARPV